MKSKDNGYKKLAKTDIFAFDEAMVIVRKVYDAYGCSAFTAPSGNMLCDLVNVAAEAAIAAATKGGAA